MELHKSKTFCHFKGFHGETPSKENTALGLEQCANVGGWLAVIKISVGMGTGGENA